MTQRFVPASLLVAVITATLLFSAAEGDASGMSRCRSLAAATCVGIRPALLLKSAAMYGLRRRNGVARSEARDSCTGSTTVTAGPRPRAASST